MEPWGVHLGSVTWADLGIALWLSFTIDWLAQPYRLYQRFRAKWVLWFWREVDRHRGVGGQEVALVKWTPLVTTGCNCANISHTTQGFERDPFLETSVRWAITIQTGIREGWRPRRALSIPSQFTLLHTSLYSLTLGNLREESVLNALQSGYLRGDGKMCGSAFVIGKWYFQNRLG